MKEERHRLTRELSDGPLQSLSGLKLRLDLCGQLVRNQETAALEDELAQLKVDLDTVMSDIRGLMVELRCPRLEALSLSDVVRRYVTEYAERTAINVTLDLSGLTDIELDVGRKLAIFRVLQEAMRNTSQHSGASEVRIRAVRKASILEVSIEDNGEGFNLLGVTSSYPRRGLGFAGMQQRAKAVGGQVEIDSQPGRGTSITLVVPVRRQGDLLPRQAEQQREEHSSGEK